jgi:uncharacterized membrane protein
MQSLIVNVLTALTPMVALLIAALGAVAWLGAVFFNEQPRIRKVCLAAFLVGGWGMASFVYQLISANSLNS